MTVPDVVARTEECLDPLELSHRETLGQRRVPVRRHRAPDPLGTAVERRRHLHLDATAIGRVRNTARVPGALEPVQYPRDSSSGQSGRCGQLAGAQSSAVFDDVETAQVGLADAEPLGGEAVKSVVLVANRSELSNDLINQLFL